MHLQPHVGQTSCLLNQSRRCAWWVTSVNEIQNCAINHSQCVRRVRSSSRRLRHHAPEAGRASSTANTSCSAGTPARELFSDTFDIPSRTPRRCTSGRAESKDISAPARVATANRSSTGCRRRISSGCRRSSDCGRRAGCDGLR